MLLVKDLLLLTGKKVTLELYTGEGYILQGSNGSGKTVLLRTLAGLYPGSFSTFSFKEKNFDDYSMEEFRSNVLYVGSSTHLAGEMTAEEFLKAPLKLAVYRNHVSNFPVEDYLKKWKLEGLKISHLSSGQKQLLVFLRTLSLKAELLLLDEPTSHLDQERTLEVEEILKSWLNPQYAYLMVSHSEEQSKRMGKRISFSDLV